MGLLHCLYNVLLNSAGWGALPLFRLHLQKEPAFRRGRFGHYASKTTAGRNPRIWAHAASVGEVTGAVSTIHSLRNRLPKAAICLSVATPQGFLFARNHLPDGVEVIPFPLDFPWVVERALHYIQPDVYVAFESEFWPNLFRSLHRRQVPTILLNGRLSSRSLRFYRLLKPLFQPIFQQFERLGMLSDEDRENVLRLGAPPERTVVLGSSKYDGLFSRLRHEAIPLWRKQLGIAEGTLVVVGGSLRRMECIELPRIFHDLSLTEPRLLGIFAPRHLEQLPNMIQWLQRRGLPFQMLSDLEEKKETRRASVILVDRIGVLFDLYALGDLTFCGGTLEPIGGHNIMEPAAWKKAVFYGPHLQKVHYEHTILQAYGGSFLAQDADDLLRQWSKWIRNLPQLKLHGEKAGEALKELGGVAEKQTHFIVAALSENHKDA